MRTDGVKSRHSGTVVAADVFDLDFFDFEEEDVVDFDVEDDVVVDFDDDAEAAAEVEDKRL